MIASLVHLLHDLFQGHGLAKVAFHLQFARHEGCGWVQLTFKIKK